MKIKSDSLDDSSKSYNLKTNLKKYQILNDNSTLQMILIFGLLILISFLFNFDKYLVLVFIFIFLFLVKIIFYRKDLNLHNMRKNNKLIVKYVRVIEILLIYTLIIYLFIKLYFGTNDLKLLIVLDIFIFIFLYHFFKYKNYLNQCPQRDSSKHIIRFTNTHIITLILVLILNLHLFYKILSKK